MSIRKIVSMKKLLPRQPQGRPAASLRPPRRPTEGSGGEEGRAAAGPLLCSGFVGHTLEEWVTAPDPQP